MPVPQQQPSGAAALGQVAGASAVRRGNTFRKRFWGSSRFSTLCDPSLFLGVPTFLADGEMMVELAVCKSCPNAPLRKVPRSRMSQPAQPNWACKFDSLHKQQLQPAHPRGLCRPAPRQELAAAPSKQVKERAASLNKESCPQESTATTSYANALLT